MTEKHNYKAALKCFNNGFEGDPDFLIFAHGKAIISALEIAIAQGEAKKDAQIFSSCYASLPLPKIEGLAEAIDFYQFASADLLSEDEELSAVLDAARAYHKLSEGI